MPDNVRYGPDNPHPLSTPRTERVWEAKYDDEYSKLHGSSIQSPAV